MDAAASLADAKVLLHPGRTRDVVNSSNHVALAVGDFHGRLGIERGRQSFEAGRWTDAATEVRSKVLQTGADGVGAARRLGNDTFDRSARGQLSRRIGERPLRRDDDKERDATPAVGGWARRPLRAHCVASSASRGHTA
jgi:hypothetical protein